MKYERVPTRVTAELLGSSWAWSTERGDRLVAKPGDYRLTDPATGAQWSSTATAFAAGYVQNESFYEARGTVDARQVGEHEDGTEVESLEGSEIAGPGDWILTDPDGNRWVVTAGVFAMHYRPADTF